MSKSLGNFFTVRDLLEQGVPGEVIRFVMLDANYGTPMDWTTAKSSNARHTLKSWYRMTDGVQVSERVSATVVGILSNDLNTHLALADMHGMANREAYPELKSAMTFLGFGVAEEVDWFREEMNMASFSNLPEYQGILWPLMKKWQALRNAKSYSEADALKKRVELAGVRLTVTIAGPEASRTEDFDLEKVRALK